MKQNYMLRITGYTDKCSVTPGEELSFYVHSEFNEEYKVDIVRLINGDTNPDGPGFKEKVIRTSVNGNYKGLNQPLMAGSYILVPNNEKLNSKSLTISAFIYPTTPKLDVEGVPVGEQAILSKWDAKKKKGYGLFINEDGELEFKLGGGRGKVSSFSSRKPLLRKVWYKVFASYDAEKGQVVIGQIPYLTATNGGHGMSMLHPREETEVVKKYSAPAISLSQNECPLLMAASTSETHTGRLLSGGHYDHLKEPLEVPEHTTKFNGKIERPRLSNAALGRDQIEILLNNQRLEGIPTELRSSIIGFWDFCENISIDAASTKITDCSPNHLHGVGVNLPVRGVIGHNWSSHFMSFKHGPQEYGAIHFHDESVDDARWKNSFTLKITVDR